MIPDNHKGALLRLQAEALLRADRRAHGRETSHLTYYRSPNGLAASYAAAVDMVFSPAGARALRGFGRYGVAGGWTWSL
jgi:hypothetical protein